MMFALGVITTLLAVIATCLIEQRLDGQGIMRTSKNLSNRILKRRVSLILPETEENDLIQDKLQINRNAGIDTPLDEI